MQTRISTLALFISALSLGACSLVRDFGQFHEVDAEVGLDGGADGGVCTPSGAEMCNGQDDDCNGVVDEAPTECSVENGTTACVAGACGLGECNPGFGDCDEDGLSCEADLERDRAHCGGCGEACSATEQCVEGGCREGAVEWAQVARAGVGWVDAGHLVRVGASDLFVGGAYRRDGGEVWIGAQRLLSSAEEGAWVARVSAGTGGVVDVWDVGVWTDEGQPVMAPIEAANAVSGRPFFVVSAPPEAAGVGNRTLPDEVAENWDNSLLVSPWPRGAERYGVITGVRMTRAASGESEMVLAGALTGDGLVTISGAPLNGSDLASFTVEPGVLLATVTEDLELASVRRVATSMGVDALALAADGDPLLGLHARGIATIETVDGPLQLGESGEGVFGRVDRESGRFEWFWRFDCPPPPRGPATRAIAGVGEADDGGIFALVNCGDGGLRTLGMDPPVEISGPARAVSVLLRFEPDGTLEWARPLGRDVGFARGSPMPISRELSVRGDAVYVLSLSNVDATSVDLGAGSLEATGRSFVLAAFDVATGALRWGRVFGSEGSDFTRDVVMDGERVFGAGTYDGAIDFGGGVQVPEPATSLTNNGVFFSFVP